VAPDFMRDQFFESVDILLLLPLQVSPKILQVHPPLCIGDVLIVSPQGVQPLA